MNDPNVVSPGILGFLAFFLLAVALYLLLRNMNGHLRRLGYRAAELDKTELDKGELDKTELDNEQLAEDHEPERPAEPDEQR